MCKRSIGQYAWVKAKTLYQSQIFNVDAFAQRLVEKRLAAGYRRGAEETERREKMVNPSVLVHWALPRVKEAEPQGRAFPV
ncbi:hypothetical protein CDG76_24965 [Nostoc sp. 'Peltigera membranacea cyanobiont' 210A]|nr:hypothetical protein CDG76_24965 [Nostoc sp. 'Peltigera membranacea cyanobiont' 210A]